MVRYTGAILYLSHTVLQMEFESYRCAWVIAAVACSLLLCSKKETPSLWLPEY